MILTPARCANSGTVRPFRTRVAFSQTPKGDTSLGVVAAEELAALAVRGPRNDSSSSICLLLGSDFPSSQFETVACDTCSLSATSPWLRPAANRLLRRASKRGSVIFFLTIAISRGTQKGLLYAQPLD